MIRVSEEADNFIDMTLGIAIIVQAFRKVFSNRNYVIITALAAMVMFSILIFLPVGRVSANVFYYQVTGLDTASLAIMAFFFNCFGNSLFLECILT